MNETSAAHVVAIIDDEVSVRTALAELLSSHGLNVQTYGSVDEYLMTTPPIAPTCLVLDLQMPGCSGLEFQQRREGALAQIVFITGHGDIASSVKAMKRGAVDFLPKPVDGSVLLEAVLLGLDKDRMARAERTNLLDLRDRYESLTNREREVLPLVVSGLLNKQSAARLGISEITFQIHRRNVMRKMQAKSLAQLVRIAMALGVCCDRAEAVIPDRPRREGAE